jgi:hypothetical protein
MVMVRAIVIVDGDRNTHLPTRELTRQIGGRPFDAIYGVCRMAGGPNAGLPTD